MIIDRPQESQLPQLRRLWQEAFGDSGEFLDGFYGAAFSRERCRCAVEDGQVTAAIYWFDCQCRGQKLAYLYALATAKAHRGKGIAHTLMADVHELLSRQGYTGTVLVPGEPRLAGLYETMGYRPFGSILEFSCSAGYDAVSLRQLSPGEYARLRRELLPPDSVIQEGENLAFLSLQADLYAGEGFLLAARREGDALAGIELLGSLSAAPGIVKALGCRQGSFRAPGEGRSFAMYRPLGSRSHPAPAYFGLAFD